MRRYETHKEDPTNSVGKAWGKHVLALALVLVLLSASTLALVLVLVVFVSKLGFASALALASASALASAYASALQIADVFGCMVTRPLYRLHMCFGSRYGLYAHVWIASD
ncbi:hypothetical protein Tco_0866898 [Tanacetum coccineum]